MVRIQEVLQDGTLGDAIEALELTDAEATVVLFNPALAPEIGLAAAAEWLWNRYGDRITDYVKRQASKEIDRLKREARMWVDNLSHDKGVSHPIDTSRPRKMPAQFKRTKPNRNMRRIQGGPGPDPDDQLIDEMKAAENPPPPESETAIPQMGKWTSYPTINLCVDLGTMELSPKGGKYGDYIPDDFVVGNWTKARNMYEWIGISELNGKQWQILSEVGTYTMSGQDHTGANMGTDDQTGTAQRHQLNPIPTFNASYRNLSFNSAQTLQEILYNLPIDSVGDTVTFTWPVPSGKQFQELWAETNSAYQLVGIRNQFVELHIKNLSNHGAGMDLAENGVEVTEQAYNPSPLKCEVMVLQAQDDIHLPLQPTGTINSPYSGMLAAGFTMVNDQSRSDDPLKPSNNNDQNYRLFYSDNGYLQEKWKVLDKKEFCLCNGQEGTMRIGMPKPQILSYKYLLTSIKGNLVTGTVGTDASFRMRTTYIKKGEQHVLVCFHGGTGIDKNELGDEVMNIKPVAAGFLWTHSYEYCFLTTEVTQEVLKTTGNVKPEYNDFSGDVNINV